jgi:hypothetical protein
MGRLLRPLALGGLLALAAAPATAGCALPPPDGDQLPFFAQIQPSDSPLDVWCRLHTLLPAGVYKAKVILAAPSRKMFEGKFRAERTVDIRIDKAEPDPRMQVATLIQSLFPTKPGAQAKDKDGQPFPLALEWTVQGTAPTTPDAPESQGLGLPSAYPSSKNYALWMPMALKLAPVRLFDQDFHLQVTFRPHVTRLIDAFEGQAERFILKAAADKALPFSETSGCPQDRAPDCKGAPPVLDVYTAWVVDTVSLTSAKQGGLSKTTEDLTAWLLQLPVKPSSNTMTSEYTATEGKGKLEFRTKTRELALRASGDPNKASGTRLIEIIWSELPKAKGGVWTSLEDKARVLRDQLVLRYAKPGQR